MTFLADWEDDIHALLEEVCCEDCEKCSYLDICETVGFLDCDMDCESCYRKQICADRVTEEKIDDFREESKL